MKTSLASLFAASLLVSSLSFAAATQTGESSATFSGKGPAGFKLEGTTNEVQLKDDGKTVTITVPLAKLDTGIDLRNKHMRENYLETDKFPHAVLEVAREAVKLPADGAKSEGTGKGKMTIRGKTREVTFKYKIEKKAGAYQAMAKVPLNIKDFDISIPSYLGVTVQPDIDTAVKFSFQEG